jgi:hypothetical protein
MTASTGTTLAPKERAAESIDTVETTIGNHKRQAVARIFRIKGQVRRASL